MADTIRQLANTEDQALSLICHAPNNAQGWIHLSSHAKKTGRSGWKLTLGYPSDEAPPTLFERKGLHLSEDIQIIEWIAHIHSHLLLPETMKPDQIADLIIALMTQIQNIGEDEELELALEE